MSDHVHMCLSIPSKYSIASTIAYIKEKSAVRIHRAMGNKKVTRLHFWSTGYCVSIVGLDKEMVKEYIRNQEKFELNQLELNFK